jgi:hypothetical protein
MNLIFKRYNGNDPKINRVLPLPQGNHVAKFIKDPIYRTKVTIITFDNLYRRVYFVMHTFLVPNNVIYSVIGCMLALSAARVPMLIYVCCVQHVFLMLKYNFVGSTNTINICLFYRPFRILFL